MNIEVDRNLLAQVAIILSLTIGGWLKFVEPSMADINRRLYVPHICRCYTRDQYP